MANQKGCRVLLVSVSLAKEEGNMADAEEATETEHPKLRGEWCVVWGRWRLLGGSRSPSLLCLCRVSHFHSCLVLILSLLHSLIQIFLCDGCVCARLYSVVPSVWLHDISHTQYMQHHSTSCVSALHFEAEKQSCSFCSTQCGDNSYLFK